MAKKIVGEDGKVYKKVDNLAASTRSRKPELIIGGIAGVVSIIMIASSFGLAAVADAFGGGGAYTGKMALGIVLAIVAFCLLFAINKHRKLIGTLVLLCGLYILFCCGVFGIIGGIIYIVDAIMIFARK
ncbi:hypothetical protein [Limosilactobacillus difficilis]|uniref:hypothetical protein n=1 Tax=Limosilactobacillus difficilis TaxID=2991838 RepID=UPI0024B97622|nr:hypothetical protein [Limosilactobacillus difficilis]